MSTLCPYAKKCGGCSLQNLTYPEQLLHKQARIIKMLGRYCRVEGIIGMDDPLKYRNKAQTAFDFRNGRAVCGIYHSASRKVLPVKECLLEDSVSSRIAHTVCQLCNQFGIKVFDLRSGKGFFRHVLVRRSFSTGDTMAVLVTAEGAFPKKAEFCRELTRRHPRITTVVWNVNDTDIPLFLGQKSEVLYGNGFISDRLCGLTFRIAPHSFYQINPIQAEVLYNKVLEFADPQKDQTVVDAYCGTGTIGLVLAQRAGRVIGVEQNPSAVDDAKFNAFQNGIDNASFVCDDAGKWMSRFALEGKTVSTVVTDPPRAGCSREFLDSLLQLTPKKIVYVSCNPETLSRDLFVLKKGGYKAKKIQPVDMFPFTGHVESVVLMSQGG